MTSATTTTTTSATPDAWPPRMKAGVAARYLGVSRRYLTQLAAEGRLAYIKIGRRCTVFQRSDLDAFLSQHRVGGEVAP